MATNRKRPTRLSLCPLETRTVPALIGFDQLTVDAATYAPDHILVQATKAVPQQTSVSTQADALGHGLYSVTLADGITVEQAIAYFSGNGYVQFAQPDYRVSVTGSPNDPSFTSLWGLSNTGQSGGTFGADIGASTAWQYNTGSGAIIVAVIDSGVDYNHPDLAANMWKNTREIPGNGKDDDGNGYKDDIYGYDFANNDANPMDDNGHGTHVAGTIGAVGNNGIGIAGINWRVKIMALKFLDANGNGYLSNAVKAINYAVANGAKIINNSYGGGGYDQAMATAINNARTKGVIFVAAAGNDGSNNDSTPSYPANYSSNNIVTVAATDRNDRLASFSNYGRTTVDIAAPGASIYSTLPNNKYGTYSGTSMATPHVAGAMALIWDEHPTWTYTQVINAVLNNVDKVSALNGKVATGGRLDLGKAMTASVTTNPTPAPTPGPTDKAGPTITGAVFRGTGNTLDTLRVTFSEAINPGSFTAGDITLTGPNGRMITVVSIKSVAGSGNTQFDVAFIKQSNAGAYRAVLGPNIADVAGNLLDQNANGRNGETTDTFTATASITGTQTFASGNVAMGVRDFGQTVATITINQDITIRDLNVQVNITHSYDNDLRIVLQGPDGTKVYLSNRRGGKGDNFTNTIFDDEAGTAITSGAAPFSGSYRPETALSQFDGKNARGTWKLIIDDYALFDTGKLNSWSLTINPGANMARVTSVNQTGPQTIAAGVGLKQLLSAPVDHPDSKQTTWWHSLIRFLARRAE